jgi:hygromycin-B 4-O-kinase
MGRLAARIHSIRTTGFGSTFEWTLNRLSHNASWDEFLENELHTEDRIQTLESCGMLQGGRIQQLRKTLETAAGKDRVPALNHGDLRLKNVLVDEEGAILCLLDWEHCSSNLAPEWDLALALHDLDIDERDEFLKGYGIAADEVLRISPVLKALTLINYAPAVHKAAKSGNDAQLERYRMRLSGALDLYSL